VTAIDTTGAGDLFASGFLYGLHKGYDMRRCGEIGSLVSGNIVQVVGSKLEECKWEELRRKS
jgi:sugar/nucleoside kinase (ribokinase family)